MPTNRNQVIERLRPVALDRGARELRELRKQLLQETNNCVLACELARKCIERYREEADPRHLGHAQSALGPWWNDAHPPVDVLVLRATLKQSQHDFTNALTDLDLAIQADSRNTQAWLTRATILTVLGRYDEARSVCFHMARLAPGLVSVTAAANVSSLTGGAEQSCELLRNALENSEANDPERVWALTILAETSARLGRDAQAREYFLRALNISGRDMYLLSSYSDFLLDQQRYQDAVKLLQDETRVDGLLIRLCIAESKLDPVPGTFTAHLDSLRARFEASRMRGDSVHQREEARFTLALLQQPQAALQLAQANWQVQREPADARVLLESALACDDYDAAVPVIEFMQTNRLQDAKLAALIKQFGKHVQ